MADFFHMNIEEADIAASLVAVAQYLGHVHLADSNRSLPGLGHLDFHRPFCALRESGFDGWLALECSVPGNPSETLLAACRFLGVAWDRAGES